MKKSNTETSNRPKRAVRSTIKSYSREEIERMIANGEDLTDWARVDAMTEEEVYANALSDPDNPPLTDEQLATMVVVYPPLKKPISIRLDSDILEFLKQDGPGYQSRINAILRAYMRAQLAR
ncbi:MAG: BrnA antitoxin family protein [Gemmatimonadaceae bacterium]